MHALRTLASLALAAAVSGCAFNPPKSDAFVAPDAGFSDLPADHVVAMYLPNRIVDALDIVHFGVGVGPGIGLELHPTRYARLGADAAASFGWGWFGRAGMPWQGAVYTRSAAGLTESLHTETGHGRESNDPSWLWRFPMHDVGAYADLVLVQGYLAFAPDELIDFVTGLATYDWKRDDL